jgi:hypothetical protein
MFMEMLGNTLQTRYTVTDTGRLNKINTVTDNTVTVRRITAEQVDSIANKIVEKLNNPTRRAYYCKVAWTLPEQKIWNNLELAIEKGKNPQKYFSYLCNKEMGR